MTKLRHLIELWLGIMTFIDSIIKMGEILEDIKSNIKIRKYMQENNLLVGNVFRVVNDYLYIHLIIALNYVTKGYFVGVN